MDAVHDLGPLYFRPAIPGTHQSDGGLWLIALVLMDPVDLHETLPRRQEQG